MSIATNDIISITESSAVSGGVISGITQAMYPISHRLLINKFQLYKASNQKIGSSVKPGLELRPFMLFEDSKQSESGVYKKFVLTGYSFRPISNLYDDVQLNEYDNTTDMTLNIV